MAKTAAKISLHNKSDTDGGIALKPRGGGGNKQALTAAATHAPAPMDLDTPAPKVGFLDGLKSAVGLGGSNGHVLIEKKSSLQPINQDDIDTEPDIREEEEDDSTVEEARGQQQQKKPAASPAKKKAVAAEPVAMDTSSPVAEEEKEKPQAGQEVEKKKKKPKKASTKGKSKSKKKAAAGQDKPKGGKGLGKDNKLPAPKRHGKKGQPKKANIDSVLCGKGLKGLARRGNVRRMSVGSVDEIKVQLKNFLKLITRDVVQITSHAKRVTVTPEDVVYALQRNGVPLWGGGIKDAKRKGKEGGDAVAAKKEAHAAESTATTTTTVAASADKAVHA